MSGEAKHNLEDVWRRQEDDRRLILDTRETVAAIGSKLDALISTVTTLVSAVNRPPAPTNWIGIAALIVSIMVATGGYIQTRFSPVERLLELHDVESRKQIGEDARVSAELQALRRDVERLQPR
jgi:hypothetical protein